MTDFLTGPRVMCHVYKLPQQLSDGYCFGGGRPIIFTNVDWFEVPLSLTVGLLIDSIAKKRYYDPNARYLVLSEQPGFTFTIEPNDPQVGS